MKRLIVIFFLCPLLAFAEPVTLDFHEIPVVTFAEATYKAILGRDFMIAPDVIGMDSKVTISIKSVEKEKLPQLLSEVLGSVGVRVREAGGIIRLERIAPASGVEAALLGVVKGNGSADNVPGELPQPSELIDYEVYRPQYRTVEYLQSVLGFAGLGGNNQNGMGQTRNVDALIISGTEERRAKLRKIIEALDQRPQVVNVRAALVEFSDSENESWSIGGILSLLAGRLSVTANAGNNSSNFARLKTGGIDVMIGAMNGDSRFRFRTQPSIRLVDGEQGKLQVGSDVPVRGNVTITQTGQQVQGTEYRPSGLVLSVLPRILKDRVQARVVQEVSNFSKTNTSGIDSPTLNKRLIEAVVDAEDGEVVVLAGLDEENVTDGVSGLFSWLPLSKSSDRRNTQLLVLLEFKRL